MIGIVTLEPDSVNSTLEQNYQKFQVKKNGPKKKNDMMSKHRIQVMSSDCECHRPALRLRSMHKSIVIEIKLSTFCQTMRHE